MSNIFFLSLKKIFRNYFFFLLTFYRLVVNLYLTDRKRQTNKKKEGEEAL